MSLLGLPYETLSNITQELETCDWNALVQCNSRLYHMLNADLYHHNVHHEKSSALFWAACVGNMKTLELALATGMSVQWESNYRLEVAEDPFLRATQPSPHRGAIPKLHPISYAAISGHIDIVAKFLDLGVDIEYRGQAGWTPLMLAARGGHFNLVQMLIAKGAGILARDIQDMQATDHASMQGHYQIADDLFQKEQNLPYMERPSQNLTLRQNLHWMLRAAAEKCDMERVKFLLTQEGVSINFQHPRGYETTLLAALKFAPQPLNIVQLLLDKGADPSLRAFIPRQYGRRFLILDKCPLEAALLRDESQPLIELLLEHNPYPSDINNGLKLAAHLKKVTEFRLLLNSATDLSGLDIMAGICDSPPIVKLIIERGITPYSDPPAHLAPNFAEIIPARRASTIVPLVPSEKDPAMLARGIRRRWDPL
ncbi:hypothetical protein N7478_000890 [Penicillium angulare]|uniref:uncharacterized protein n=1 Tax=Penicillium angulare TaxID=116970 RepID=UPI00253F685D|nr:uncharacterized protein N7478_000890 [Penicillium angulare]KAJ5291639.1 hypothetical protein N7478_000890 [Penicillium angulare]